MGAIVNALTIEGLRAFGATFLVFSDYMRGAIRLAAVMEIPSIFVFTHDSIGVGEDGPTHQPIEQLASLRAMPNIEVIRPADGHETFLAWQFLLGSASEPTVLALSSRSCRSSTAMRSPTTPSTAAPTCCAMPTAIPI